MPLPLQADAHGVLRVGNTRVTLESIIYAYQAGEIAEQIAYSFDTLKLADIHAVISYYLNNRDEVERYLNERQNLAEGVRLKIEGDFGRSDLRTRLLARKENQLQPILSTSNMFRYSFG